MKSTKSAAPAKSQRPMPRPRKLAPSKSRRPMHAGPAREDRAMKLKLESIARSDQGTTDALPREGFKKGGMVRGCGAAMSGKKYSGTF